MAKETKVKDIDITKTGPQSFRQLQQANNADFSSEVSPEVRDFIEKKRQRAQSFTLYDPYRQAEQEISSPLSGATSSWGESMFDEETATEAQFQELGDVRAENQPWYAQIGAGLAKGAILAGTTFLDGTIGLVLGAGTAINEGRWSGLWDNEFSRAMQSINEWSEEVLPNYYTKAELEQPWYENVFSANFLGDKFIKNLGFTIGAFYSGGVTAAGLKATKLPQLIGAIAKSSKAPAIVNTAVGATVSAVNEGRIEALNNSKDWFELHKAELDDNYAQRIQAITDQYQGTEMYEQMMYAEMEAYNQALGKLSEDRLKMGNADLLMNIPILTASNIIQFGKLYANGFKTARRATNIAGKAGEYAAGTTKLGSALAITRGALSEGTEEIPQKAASVTAGNYYSIDVNNFYKSKTDPEASQETLSWVKSFAEGINETVNDGSSWEEFFIGTLTGALGMPRFRSTRSKEGGFQSPITFEGGAINEWREYNEKMARESEIANYMNSRINSPEFKNYYQGLIRHKKYQNDMDRAAEEGDEFNFKNAEHAQLVSDIAMFDNAGKMEDLITLIDTAFDTSDENLASIVENTTTTLEDGSKVGPFVDKNGNPMYATPEGKQEMIDKLKQNHDEMTNAINEYLKIKEEIDTRTGQQLSDSQLEELTWMKSQLSNWAKRAETMSGEVKSAISNVIGNLDSLLRFNQQVRDFEGQYNKGITELYDKTDANIRSIESAINTLSMVRSQDDKTLAYTLATNPKFVEGLIKEINELKEDVLSADEKEDVINKLNDIVKLGNASKTYNTKLKEYLENPQKQAEDHARADEEAVRQEEKRKSDDLRTSLYNAKNLQEFRSIVDSQDDIENRDRVLNALEAEGNERAKNYRETLQYNNEVRRLVNESDAEPQAKQDAIKLLQDQFNNSENLEQIANPNSIYVNNENAFDEASEGDVELSASRFQEAQYTLQKAMSKANNDNRFKDRFSPEYKKPVVKREGTTRGDNRETTGDSGTTTTPIVTSSEGLPTVDTPVGNITIEMVSEENKSTNGRVEAPQRPSKDSLNQFYRPAIPELHIEASKEGDFRPFDIVVGEKEKNADFSGIYGYLRDQGAFRYVNEGNLKPGDELGFMVDPDFNETTIFIIDKRNNQVVGSLDESDYSVSRYEGLKSLEEKIKQEYSYRGGVTSIEDVLYITRTEDGYTPLTKLQEWSKKTKDVRTNPDGVGTYNGLTYYKIKAGYRGGDNVTIWFRNTPSKRVLSKTEEILKASTENKYNLIEVGNLILEEINKENARAKFIATPTTRVSKVMVGRIPYGNTERSLSEIPNVSSPERKPIFGIIKNGVLTTNGKIDDSLIIKPVDMSQKEGRLYLLIPNGAGKYSPAAVRVKHFNNEEFNLDDITVASTIIGGDIKNAITRLSTSTSQDDVSAAMQDLAQDLYMQDVMVNWFDSRAGSGITISKKVRKPDGTYEKVNIEGKEQIKEDKYNVYFSTSSKSAEIGGISFDVTALEKLGDTSALGVPKDPSLIYNEILNILTKFNLPLQVSTGRINEGAYNDKLINSNILTSNIIEATVRSTWFTTDYFDNEGNLHKAISPASVTPQPKRKVETPVGGTEGAISGTKIIGTSGNVYYVDLKSNTAKNENGETVVLPETIKWLAWIQDNFGDAQDGSLMVGGKALLPDGRVFDRNTKSYVVGQEAQDVKDTIAGRKKEKEDRVAKSKEVISEIYENQKKVDKTRTDGEFYYILEDDGEFHQYSRVHSRLGSNWVESTKQTEALSQVRLKLSQLVDNPSQFNNYLKFLENKYKISLDGYQGKTDAKSRDVIANIVRDKMSGTSSQRALDAGSAVDSIIRQYFTIKDISKIVRPSNMTESAFIDLITTLNSIKSNMENTGERFLADNIILYQKYPDGTRVAGEVDILSVDKDGNFRIYDVKTSRYSFYDFTDRYGHKVNYFNTPSATQRMSAKDYYTLQLSAYKNLFESQYGVPITKLAILPFVLSYDRENVSGVQKEKGILINYNPSVNVPLVGNVQTPVRPITPAKPVNNYITTEDRLKERKLYTENKSFNPKGEPGKDFLILSYEYEYEGKKKKGDYRIIKVGDTYYYWWLNAENGRNNWYYYWEKLPNKYLEKAKELFGESPVNNLPQVLPIFETSLETQNPVDRVLPENSLGNTSVIGYYEKDGKLYKGYIRKVGVIGDIPIYITKERDRGFGREGEMNKSSSYFVILPNGKLVDTKTLSQSDDEAATVIMKALSAKPQKVKDLAAEKTILFDPSTAPVSSALVSTETPANINQGTTQTGAAYTSQKEQAINNNDEEFEDELDLEKLRKVDESLEAPVWNQEKELAWLSKVLPQLSEQGRVQVVKGLIEVGKKGTLAWGQFDKGIVKLSDIAAEGTTYHEAFHVVFNLLLDKKERQSLYNEAKKLYGEKDDLSLEEDMAEGFREYVMTRQSRSLGKKILDFFKELFTKVTHWNSFRPSLISYYRRINEGKYSSSEFKVSTISELRGTTTTTTSFGTLSNNIQEALSKKGWTAEKFDSISQEERDQAVKCIAF